MGQCAEAALATGVLADGSPSEHALLAPETWTDSTGANHSGKVTWLPDCTYSLYRLVLRDPCAMLRLLAACLPPPSWAAVGQRRKEGVQPCARCLSPLRSCFCEESTGRSFGKENYKGTANIPSYLPSFQVSWGHPTLPAIARAFTTTPIFSSHSSWVFCAFLCLSHWSENLPVYSPASGVAQPSPWQQPRESCPLPGNCP